MVGDVPQRVFDERVEPKSEFVFYRLLPRVFICSGLAAVGADIHPDGAFYFGIQQCLWGYRFGGWGFCDQPFESTGDGKSDEVVANSRFRRDRPIFNIHRTRIEGMIDLVECPRDAMQGIKTWIPTEHKALYMQALLNCGFHTLDFGSFVSPKAIPQMRDTAAVLGQLDLSATKTKLLAIVANLRGAQSAVQHPEITYLGYPFSISENFQMRNTHKTIEQSVEVLEQILETAAKYQKEVVTYLSMGFGNPYGDPWNVDIVAEWVERLSSMGVGILSLSDTVGSSTAEIISSLYSDLIPRYPKMEFGAHLHTRPDQWHEKVHAAYQAGCRRFDGAIQGFGGCPMAKDELTGNMPTEKMLSYFNTHQLETGVGQLAFEAAYNKASDLFGVFH